LLLAPRVEEGEEIALLGRHKTLTTALDARLRRGRLVVRVSIVGRRDALLGCGLLGCGLLGCGLLLRAGSRLRRRPLHFLFLLLLLFCFGDVFVDVLVLVFVIGFLADRCGRRGRGAMGALVDGGLRSGARVGVGGALDMNAAGADRRGGWRRRAGAGRRRTTPAVFGVRVRVVDDEQAEEVGVKREDTAAHLAAELKAGLDGRRGLDLHVGLAEGEGAVVEIHRVVRAMKRDGFHADETGLRCRREVGEETEAEHGRVHAELGEAGGVERRTRERELRVEDLEEARESVVEDPRRRGRRRPEVAQVLDKVLGGVAEARPDEMGFLLRYRREDRAGQGAQQQECRAEDHTE
jgi:hypothetical protein